MPEVNNFTSRVKGTEGSRDLLTTIKNGDFELAIEKLSSQSHKIYDLKDNNGDNIIHLCLNFLSINGVKNAKGQAACDLLSLLLNDAAVLAVNYNIFSPLKNCLRKSSQNLTPLTQAIEIRNILLLRDFDKILITAREKIAELKELKASEKIEIMNFTTLYYNLLSEDLDVCQNAIDKYGLTAIDAFIYINGRHNILEIEKKHPRLSHFTEHLINNNRQMWKIIKECHRDLLEDFCGKLNIKIDSFYPSFKFISKNFAFVVENYYHQSTPSKSDLDNLLSLFEDLKCLYFDKNSRLFLEKQITLYSKRKPPTLWSDKVLNEANTGQQQFLQQI